MALPENTLGTMFRRDYLPVMPNVWAKKDYAMAAYFFKHMEGFQTEKLMVDVEYQSQSVATHVGVNDNLAVGDVEFATQGYQDPEMFLDVLRINHKKLMNINTKADARKFMTKAMNNVTDGMRENWVKHILTREASSSQWLRLYDMIYATTSALHALTPADFPNSGEGWTPQSINASTYGAVNRAALMNEGEKSYFPSLIRRLISKCDRWGDTSDMKVYVQGYHWDLLNDLIDAKKIGSYAKKEDVYLGIEQIWIGGVAVVKDNWMSYGQTTDKDCIAYLINHKHIKMRANRKAMFSLIGNMIPAQTNTAKVNQIGLYGNFTDDKRNASGFIHTLYGELNYN